MATVNGFFKDESRDGSVLSVTWEGLNSTDLDGAPVKVAEWADRTVQMVGTFDTGTVTMQGSNDGSNWETLTDPLGNNVALTDEGIKALLEGPLYMRPLLSSAGASSDVDVIMIMRRNNPMRT